MSTTVENFFTPPEGEALRDPRGRPLLVPRGVDPASGVRAAYSRASGLASEIENMEHIHRWEMRYLAKAMGRHEDLAALAAVEPYSTGLTATVFGRDKSASGRRLDDIIRRALDRERIHEKADAGTTVHGATEPGVVPIEAVPERFRHKVRSFEESVRVNGIRIAETEQFTANDVTMTAGTFDHLVQIPGMPTYGEYLIGDKKTGRYSPFEWCIQLATYAYGEPYDVDTDTRRPWPGEVDLEHGIIFLIGEEETTLHIVDLAFGWEMAQIAARVRDAHDRNDICHEAPARALADIAARVEQCSDLDGLRVLWDATEDQTVRQAILAKVERIRACS